MIPGSADASSLRRAAIARVCSVCAAFLAGCATLGRAAVELQPLESEGELYVELKPDASLQFESISALRADGTAIPLQPNASGTDSIRYQHLIAAGRLEAGTYAGLLAVSGKTEQRIEAPFSISRRAATVLEIDEKTGAIPPRTLVSLLGFCTNSAWHSLSVFDKHARVVTGVIPTARAPWGIALDPVSNRAYVSLAEDDQVAVVDLLSGQELARVHLNAGDSPREIMLTPDRRFVISANAGSNTISFLDVRGLIETARVQVGEEPVFLLPDRSGRRLFVFNQRSNSISVLDLSTRAKVAVLSTDNSPLRAQIDRANARLFVASSRAAYLTVYSLADFSVQQRVYVGLGTSALKVDPDTDLLYVANADGHLSVFDPFSLIPIDQFDLPEGPSYLAIDAAESVLFALLPERGAVAAIQLTTKSTLALFDVGKAPRVLALIGERN